MIQLFLNYVRSKKKVNIILAHYWKKEQISNNILMASCLNSAYTSMFTTKNTQLISIPMNVFISPKEHKLLITEINVNLVSIYFRELDLNMSSVSDV